MPTRYRRIPVTNDPPLAEALARVERHFDGAPAAKIVHDLAIKGAEAVEREQGDRAQAIERLIALFTEPNDALDLDYLKHVRELAWGE